MCCNGFLFLSTAVLHLHRCCLSLILSGYRDDLFHCTVLWPFIFGILYVSVELDTALSFSSRKTDASCLSLSLHDLSLCLHSFLWSRYYLSWLPHFCTFFKLMSALYLAFFFIRYSVHFAGSASNFFGYFCCLLSLVSGLLHSTPMSLSVTGVTMCHWFNICGHYTSDISAICQTTTQIVHLMYMNKRIILTCINNYKQTGWYTPV